MAEGEGIWGLWRAGGYSCKGVRDRHHDGWQGNETRPHEAPLALMPQKVGTPRSAGEEREKARGAHCARRGRWGMREGVGGRLFLKDGDHVCAVFTAGLVQGGFTLAVARTAVCTGI